MSGSKVALGFTPGDVVVVTGAASGIGRATALRAAEVGLVVGAWDIDGAGAKRTASDIDGTALAVEADVADAEQVEAAFAQTRALGPVRRVVNNAGPASSAQLEFNEALAISVGSMRQVVETWLETDPPAGASVVNVASVAGNVIGVAPDWYAAAKAAVMGYTRHLASYRADRMRANAVAPGMTDTPRLAEFAASEVGQRALARNPLHRMATPDEVAWAVLFLLSPLASYINGVMLAVDGGWTVTQ